MTNGLDHQTCLLSTEICSQQGSQYLNINETLSNRVDSDVTKICAPSTTLASISCVESCTSLAMVALSETLSVVSSIPCVLLSTTPGLLTASFVVFRPSGA